MGILREYVSNPMAIILLQLTRPQANVLINRDGHACLADFSLLTMAPDQSTLMLSCVKGGTIRWMSPELIDPGSFYLKETRPTKESDCYALGMVIYEVLTGATPFSLHSTPLVIKKVLEGERPEKPKGKEGAPFTNDLWKILELCWKQRPAERTNVKDVLACLEGISSLPRSSPDADEIVKTDTDELLDVTMTNPGMFSQFCRRSQADLQSPSWDNRYNDYT